MLRVGLTGGLGSGKTTVARMFACHGVSILEADLIGRELMQPGQPVYQEILRHFVQYPDALPLTDAGGMLDRSALAAYVFSTNRLQELNRIIHPAVIAEQERRMQILSQQQPDAIVMVESALIFEADRGGTVPGLSHRFDKLILVTAPEDTRIARYIERVSGGRTISCERRRALEEDARRRIGMQMTDAEKVPLCDFVIENSGPLDRTETAVHRILAELRQFAEIAGTKPVPE